MNDDADMTSGIIEDKDLLDNTQTLMSFGLDWDEQVIKLALKKNSNNIEEALLMLTSDALEGLKQQVADEEVHKAYIPIITHEEKEEDKNDDQEEEEESKLNLILSNKSEYFDIKWRITDW